MPEAVKVVRSVGRILGGAALLAAAGLVLSGHVDIRSRGLVGTVLARLPAKDPRIEAARTPVAGAARLVTAYNVGDPEQTSGDPCIGASGHDLCDLVERGLPVCAANFVALGTILRIEDYGECVVLDRMDRRHARRVDIAMKRDDLEEAVAFGARRRLVEVGE